MTRREPGRRSSNYLRVAVAVAAGIVAFLLLFPFAGVDTQPPRYYSVFGNRVPTGTLWAALPAAAVAVWIAWTLFGRGSREGRGG